MFRAVISRDGGCPWGSSGLSSATWRDVPAEPVTIADLVATQPGVLFEALAADATPVGGDPLPHVIEWRGQRYLEDGHHRVVRAALGGATVVSARVLQVAEEAS